MSDKCISAICELKRENAYGIVTMHQCPHKQTIIKMQFTGMPKNKIMAIHIHEYGDMRRGCDSLGKHYNPDNKEHGSFDFPTEERHIGDLINNITTDNNGNFNKTYIDTSVNVIEVLGRSIVIHEGQDDLGQGKGDRRAESKITGNAGKRFMCGIIGICTNDDWRQNPRIRPFDRKN
jgi:Cu/Zn superoxide dismutase